MHKTLQSRPLLSQEEFNRFCKDVHSPNSRLRKIARDEILLANTRLVYREVRKALKTRPMHMRDIEMDLFQEGVTGLMRAIEKFDPSQNNQFSTYAVPWIRQGIRRYADRNTTTVKVPGAEVAETRIAIANEDEVNASVVVAMSPTRISEEFDLADTGISPEEAVLSSLEMDDLRESFSALSSDQSYIICRKFKLEGYEDLTRRAVTSNKAIAEELEITPGEVAKLYKEALDVLRSSLAVE